MYVVKFVSVFKLLFILLIKSDPNENEPPVWPCGLKILFILLSYIILVTFLYLFVTALISSFRKTSFILLLLIIHKNLSGIVSKIDNFVLSDLSVFIIVSNVTTLLLIDKYLFVTGSLIK